MRLILLATLGADIAPPGPVHLRGGRRLLPIYWPAGPQTVKTNQRSISLPKLPVRLRLGNKKPAKPFGFAGWSSSHGVDAVTSSFWLLLQVLRGSP